MTVDANQSIRTLHERMLGEGHGIIGRAQQLCERVLASQGDRPDAGILQLQHDCVLWHEKWNLISPIEAVTDVDAEYERSVS